MFARFLKTVVILELFAVYAIAVAAAKAEVIRQDDNRLSQELQMPVYQWQDGHQKPRAVLLAIHGLTLHGKAYDSCARHLAKERMLVVAPDLRGYGKWQQNHQPANFDYKKSETDLAALATRIRSTYAGVPLIIVGESLGGALAIRLAAHHPQLVDGLVLSSPAIKHCHLIPLKTAVSAALALVYPFRPIDVSGYIKNYFSEDPEICFEELKDPLVRKNLSLGELISTCRLIASTEACIRAIPNNMPVLILQGRKDRMVKSASIDLLERTLRTKRASIHWFPERGHILLETAHIKTDTLHIVSNWLDKNCCLRHAEGETVATQDSQKHS